jgi:hypothetical protein
MDIVKREKNIISGILHLCNYLPMLKEISFSHHRSNKYLERERKREGERGR